MKSLNTKLNTWFPRKFISIFNLLASGSPATIFFTVIPVIINSINRGIRIIFTVMQIRIIHIFFKFFKGFPYNLYSSPSIISINRSIGISTSIFHSFKYSIKSTSRLTMTRIPFCSNLRHYFSLKTSTRKSTITNLINSTTNYFSTVTFIHAYPTFSYYFWKKFQKRKISYFGSINAFFNIHYKIIT